MAGKAAGTLSIPKAEATELRLQRLADQGGFGSVRVEVTIGDVRWQTSLFPAKLTGEYPLPVKAEVRRRANIAAGDEVTVAIELV